MSQFSALREEAGVEIHDIVDEFSASYHDVLEWETGRKSPPPELMRALRTKETTSTVCKADQYINTLFEGDCLDILPTIPDESVNLVLCDLPYGTTQNKWDSVINLERLWAEYRRVLKDNGVVVLTSQGIFTAKLILSNEEWFKYKIVWEKSKSTNFLNAKKQPLRKHEDICVFYGKPPTYNPQMKAGKPYDKGVRKDQLSGCYGDFQPVHVKSEGSRYPSDIVYFKTAESEPGRQVWHPTQKPLDLGRYLVRTYTNVGDVVLDNAFGSGSFLLAAALEERRFIGIERNQESVQFKNKPADFIEIADSRLRDARVSPHLVRRI
ncbi:DNA-methyltransferase [Erythrobacter sp. EC-HK427]|uniref:DNA-methyltransferase n=1 Tax=Erythrobacter sp. EC-HK427 TaxID=2038396 RepID=UPI0012577716|nr:site-specific DNA-methyltransferase [Erythrobacter sp. EC-HK427]VVT09739.1 Methyltransferase (modular protein) [Erythrobacter sp. EC-HK427]